LGESRPGRIKRGTFGTVLNFTDDRYVARTMFVFVLMQIYSDSFTFYINDVVKVFYDAVDNGIRVLAEFALDNDIGFDFDTEASKGVWNMLIYRILVGVNNLQVRDLVLQFVIEKRCYICRGFGLVLSHTELYSGATRWLCDVIDDTKVSRTELYCSVLWFVDHKDNWYDVSNSEVRAYHCQADGQHGHLRILSLELCYDFFGLKISPFSLYHLEMVASACTNSKYGVYKLRERLLCPLEIYKERSIYSEITTLILINIAIRSAFLRGNMLYREIGFNPNPERSEVMYSIFGFVRIVSETEEFDDLFDEIVTIIEGVEYVIEHGPQVLNKYGEVRNNLKKGESLVLN
jgi:hypothetical protein